MAHNHLPDAFSTENVARFFDELAPRWDGQAVDDPRKIARILDAARVTRGVRVLDVACGTGVLFPFYLARDVRRVTAVDLSREMARIAAGKARDARIEVIAADIEALAPAAEYDAVVLYNAFPHFPDPARLVERLCAWLAPGGHLTIAHGMGIEQLNHLHMDGAPKVSRGMLPIGEMTALLSRFLRVDTAVSEADIYIASGTLRPGVRGDGPS